MRFVPRQATCQGMSLFPDDAPYRVLARKYRPATFDALIGQDALVTTLANSIASNRLAQAWLLTGVRGVGKTSTARIIAKALNCIGPDGQGGPTVTPCEHCANCTAISAGQHIDVIEMDAASNTGVDDIREIIDSVRYASVSARYKIHIIDEVHMLSKSAFNALLKTLEEPPPHVKFIFATTEVQKLPATILSRCQRFDLKRIPTELLASHFAAIATAEGVTVAPEALALIARAADGSVRDGLSILDQAIAQAGSAPVAADAVRDMLGLADRGRLVSLMAAILAADPPRAVTECETAYNAGVEPAALIEGLLDLVHGVTRARLSGGADPALGETDRRLIGEWAAALAFPALHRLWQLLLKGHADVCAAPVPQQAAIMAILRCVHGAGLPTPDDLLRRLADSPPAPPAMSSPPAPPAMSNPPAPPALSSPPDGPADAAALLALFAGREPLLARHLHDDAAVLHIGDRWLRLGDSGRLPPRFADEVGRRLSEWLGAPWRVTVEASSGTPTMRDIERLAGERAREQALHDPLVQAFRSAFPASELLAASPAPPDPADTTRRVA